MPSGSIKMTQQFLSTVRILPAIAHRIQGGEGEHDQVRQCAIVVSSSSSEGGDAGCPGSGDEGVDASACGVAASQEILVGLRIWLFSLSFFF